MLQLIQKLVCFLLQGATVHSCPWTRSYYGEDIIEIMVTHREDNIKMPIIV